MKRWTCLFAAVLGMAASASGQEWECHPLETPDSGGRFGCAVATDGRSVAISANGAGDEARGIPDAGSVTVFDGAGKTETIFASDAAPGDQFGISLDLAGLTLAVGAPGVDLPEGDDAGAVYVLQRAGAGWVEQQPRLTAGESARRGAAFGESVALRRDGSLLAVGAPSDSGDGSLAGAVYVFTRSADGWTPTWTRTRLKARPDPFDGFGSSVALDGDTLAVGAPFADGSRGEVWIFRRRGADWDLLRRITAGSFARAGAQLGSAVSLGGGALAVAATRDDPDGRADAGAVYLFSADGSTLLQRLAPSGLRAGDLFGSAIALDGERLLVGARLRDRGAGAAYLFERIDGRWTEVPGPPGSPGGELGQAVALSGDRAVLGAYLRDRAESCSLVEKLPDLVCRIDGPVTVSAGGTATWSVVVSNVGEGLASGVELGDFTPAGLSLEGSGAPCGTLPCLLGTIDPGDSRRTTVTFRVPASCEAQKPFRPTASVQGSGPESDAANNTCRPARSTRIRPPAAGCEKGCPDPFRNPGDPAAELPPGTWGIVEGPATAEEGSLLAYRILLANGGPDALPDGPGHELEHLLPPGIEPMTLEASSGEIRALEDSPSGDPTRTLVWNGDLPLCGTVTIEILARVFAASGSEICLQGTLGPGRLTGLRGRIDGGEPLCVEILPEPPK